jgi:hypothetical protein
MAYVSAAHCTHMLDTTSNLQLPTLLPDWLATFLLAGSHAILAQATLQLYVRMLMHGRWERKREESRERERERRAVKTHIEGILIQHISKQMEYCSSQGWKLWMWGSMTLGGLGWNVSAPRWGKLSSPPPAHHHCPPKGTCASVSSSRYHPLLPTLQKYFVHVYMYSWHQNV